MTEKYKYSYTKKYTEITSEEHKDFDAYLIDEMALAEKQEHFWFIARLKVIKKLFLKYIPKNTDVLDIGAGTGFVAHQLQGIGYNVTVGDIHDVALRNAKIMGIEQRYLMDIYAPPFHNKYDVITLFDVLEHLDEEKSALKNLHYMVKKDGYIMLTVPAHMWLWNDHDELAGHKRRYTKKQLIKSVEDAGFEIQSCSFIFKLIVPLLFLRRLLSNGQSSHAKGDLFKIHPLLNKGLALVHSLESKIDFLLPNITGGSLILLGKKVSSK